MNRFWTTLRAFVVAALATGLMAAVRGLVLIPVFDFEAPAMPSIVAIMLAAWIGGLKSGLFATVLNAGLLMLIFEGRFGLYFVSVDNQVRLVMLVAIGGLISWGIESLRDAQRRLEDRHRELEIEMRRRERVEAALREQDSRVRLAIEAAEIGTWDFNPLTGEQEWSGRAKEMFGLSADADVSKISFRDRIHPDDRERVNQAIQRAYDPGGDGAYEVDCRLVWPDNTIHWFIARGQALFEGDIPHRRATRLIGTVFDITERKRAEEVVRASEIRLRGILDHMPAAISLKDLAGRYVLVNRSWESLFGLKNDEAVGATNYELLSKTTSPQMSKEIADQFVEIDRTVIRTGQLVTFEDDVPSGDDLKLFSTVKFPIKDAAGGITGVGGISIDVGR